MNELLIERLAVAIASNDLARPDEIVQRSVAIAAAICARIGHHLGSPRMPRGTCARCCKMHATTYIPESEIMAETKIETKAEERRGPGTYRR